ncbi:MAG: PepSY domain-containing protein [Silanimonas sp.]
MPAFRLLIAALTLALVAGGARAQQDEAPPPPAFDDTPAPSADTRRSELPESVLRAERQTGGEVLRAESMQRDGREVYRLKVLTPDGRVRIMRDDPRERRREAWREARGNAMRDPFAEPRALPRDDRFGDSRREERREDRLERFDAPPPAELDVPETLPPVERGDRY